MTEIIDDSDWPYLQNAATNLFLPLKVLDDAIETIVAAGYSVVRLNCATDQTLLESLVHGLKWKEQFGYTPSALNLDALNDAVRGEPFNTTDQGLIVLERFSGYWKRGKHLAFNVLDIFETNTRHYLLHGKRLLIFVKVSDPRFHVEGFGGVAAQWNPKERYHKDRDL
jgi:hypothetical protein